MKRLFTRLVTLGALVALMGCEPAVYTPDEDVWLGDAVETDSALTPRSTDDEDYTTFEDVDPNTMEPIAGTARGFTEDGAPILLNSDGKAAFTAEGTLRMAPMPRADDGTKPGNYGTSTASGCRRATARNEKEVGLLQVTAYWHNTTITWCWHRGSDGIGRRVYNIKRGAWFDDIRWDWHVQGLHRVGGKYYQYYAGWGASGYAYYRQPWMQQCIGGDIGQCLNFYPWNKLHPHANGTYYAATS